MSRAQAPGTRDSVSVPISLGSIFPTPHSWTLPCVLNATLPWVGAFLPPLSVALSNGGLYGQLPPLNPSAHLLAPASHCFIIHLIVTPKHLKLAILILLLH